MNRHGVSSTLQPTLQPNGAGHGGTRRSERDADDEVWVTHVPALGHLSTYGDTRDEALRNTHEAVLGYLEAAEREQLPVPTDDTPFDVVDIEVAVS